MKIVHVIPTYNEKENVGRMIQTINNIGKKYPRWDNNILIVDDYSPDKTSDVVRQYQKKFKNISLIQKKKEGLGRALITGYEYAMQKLKADVVIPNDADFQWDPLDYPKLIKKIEEGYDVVVASRHVAGGGVKGWGWFRILNHEVSNTLLAWWFAGVHEVRDHAGNFKAIRVKNVLDRVKLNKMKNAGFSFQLHILFELSKTGAKFCEVPSLFTERKFGKSKIGLNRYYIRDVAEYIKSSFLIRTERSASFFKYAIVGLIGYVIQLTVISVCILAFKVEESNAVVVGAETAIISNFILNNYWSFSHKRIAGLRIIRKFIQFNIAALGSIIIQKIISWLGATYISRNIIFTLVLNMLTIGIIIIPYSFFVYNRFIWKPKK